jgi:hypothetical protein
MNSQNLHRSAGAPTRLAACCMLSALATTGVAGDLANRDAPYARMAPLDQYLMDPSAEIALARSAAPAAISAGATVLILKRQGYQTAVAGTNGFTCIVERSWMAPFDNPEFWNPRMRAPICYNPAASRSILSYSLKRTELALAGRSRDEMLAEMRGALAHNELAQPEPGAMSYMMSKDGYLGDSTGHWHSHLMFHVPKAPAASWGANLPGSPVILDERLMPEPEAIFMVPVTHWSDGTEAPAL